MTMPTNGSLYEGFLLSAAAEDEVSLPSLMPRKTSHIGGAIVSSPGILAVVTIHQSKVVFS